MVIWFSKQIKKVKKLDKWVSHELNPNFLKNCPFEVLSSLILFNNNEPFLNWMYTTTGDNQLNGWTEKKLQSTSQNQTCPHKKVMVTVRWSAACAIHSNFLNPSKTITSEKYPQQIDELHQKLELALVKKKPSSPQQCLIARGTTNASKAE